LKSIKVIETKNGGIFLSFPNQKSKDGNYHDLVVIEDKEFAQYLRTKIIEEYKKSLDS
jgi:stage V sporulation protein G